MFLLIYATGIKFVFVCLHLIRPIDNEFLLDIVFSEAFSFLSFTLSVFVSFDSSMDVSLSSATSRVCMCSFSPEPFLLKSAKIPTWERSLMSPSSNRRIGQPLFARTGPLSAKDNSVKVVSSLKKEVTVVEGRSMSEIYDALAERLSPTAAAMANPNLKFIGGLAGSPGAEKSTVAHEVVQRVNKLWPQKACTLDSQVTPPSVAALLPMDGFHLYHFQLDAMENPEEAHARRGASWTFSPELLLKCLKTLRSQG